MKKLIISICLVCCVGYASNATVRFGVGAQWLGNTDMAVGFNVGGGNKDLGIEVAHYGIRPTLYDFGSVELSQNLVGLYYLPVEWFMLQAGLHNTVLNLSADKEEILGTKSSVNWTGPYAILSFPIRVEKYYFVNLYYGFFTMGNGLTQTAYGIGLGADFDPQEQKVLF